MSKVIPQNYEAWVTSKYSPQEIHLALVNLNVSHKVDTGIKVFHDLGYEQPKKVRITNKVMFVKNTVNLLVLPYTKLGLTNIPRFPDLELSKALKVILRSSEKIVPKVITPSIEDYTSSLAAPSALVAIQTIVGGLKPIELKTKTNAMVLNYLNSRISFSTASKGLKNNLKTEALIPLLKDASALRQAVVLTKTLSEEEVSAQTGISIFDLKYLNRLRNK